MLSVFCDTCRKVTMDNSLIKFRDKPELQVYLRFCAPQLNLKLVSDWSMCMTCAKTLQSAYNFIYQCLQREESVGDFNDVETDSLQQPCWFISTPSNMVEVDEVRENASCRNLDSGCMENDLADIQNLEPLHQECFIKLEPFTDVDNCAVNDCETDEDEAVRNFSEREFYPETFVDCSLDLEYDKTFQVNLEDGCWDLPETSAASINESVGQPTIQYRNQLAKKPHRDVQVSSSVSQFMYYGLPEVDGQSNELLQKTVSKKKSYISDHCSYKAGRNRELLNHTKTMHSTLVHEERFVCPSCPYTVKRKWEMVRHVRAFHTAPRLGCKFCPRKFFLKKQLKQHIKNCHFNCTKCSYRTYTKTDLRRHTYRDHGDLGTFSFPRAKETLIYCKHCAFATCIRANLKKHVLCMHAKRFPCSCCPYSSTYKNVLIKHMLTHTKKNIYSCT